MPALTSRQSTCSRQLYSIDDLRAALQHERRRIARSIHDNSIQQIAHTLHKLELIQLLIEKEEFPQAYREVLQARSSLSIGLHHLRTSTSSQLSTQLEDTSFFTALQTVIDQHRFYNPTMEITTDLQAIHQIPSQFESSILHFIQEALNNIQKHAQATAVSLSIHLQTDTLVIAIHDNGVGFRPEHYMYGNLTSSSAPHSGLRIMRERIQETGGIWEVQSAPNAGTTIRARFPAHRTSVPLTHRECEVLRLLTEGLTNRAIAEQLSISNNTVKSHVHHIMQKMQVKDRTQVAVFATRHGWLYGL